MATWAEFVEDVDSEFAERLRRLRERAGIRQVDLAETLRLQRTSVTNLESGKQTPTLPQVIAIAQALGVDYKELIPSVAAPSEERAALQMSDRVEPYYRLREKILKAHAK